MEDEPVNEIHWSFWVIGVVALLWNLMGVANFLVQMNPGMIGAYREAEQAIIDSRPAWATMAFALGVFGGALGCGLLLLKQSVSHYFFIASLLGVIVTMIHTLSLGIGFGLGEIIGVILMPLVVAAFLIWYSKRAENKGWITSKGFK